MQTPQATAKTPKRLRPVFKGTNAQMLGVSLVQVDNLIPIQPDLAKRRKKLTPQYLTDLRAEIAAAIKDKLGLNPHTLVQELTGELKTTQSTILGLFRSFYLDLRDAFSEADDKTRLPELRALLGFRDHYTDAQALNQQALAELLATFVTATKDAQLRTELEDDLGLSTELIDSIRAQENFFELDAAQEKGKSNAPVITADTLRAFNSIYKRVQSPARLARDLYKTDDARAAQFSYSQLRRKMTGGASTPPDDKTPNS